MSTNYRTFFGMKKEAFGADLSTKEIFETDDIRSVQERFDYAVRLGAIALVTGEIGSGKSTALRYVAARLHPSEYLCLCSGTVAAKPAVEKASPHLSCRAAVWGGRLR